MSIPATATLARRGAWATTMPAGRDVAPREARFSYETVDGRVRDHFSMTCRRNRGATR